MSRPVSVAETALFLRQADGIWSDEERTDFVDYIARNPTAGDIIRDTGGIRKIRWRRQGSGKRGGVRVIYFFHDVEVPIYLLMIYAKARREDLSVGERNAARALSTELKRAWAAARKTRHE